MNLLNYNRTTLSRLFGPMVFKAARLDFEKALHWLQTTETWNREMRLQYQVQKLSAMVEFCWDTIPFYKEYWSDHGVKRAPLRSLDELNAYPVLPKETFRSNYLKIRPTDLSAYRYQQKHTGGTTGVPVHYLQDLDQWTLMQAFLIWGWSLAGYKYGDPVGVIAGGSLVPENRTAKVRLRNYLENKIFLFGVHMNDELGIDYHHRLSRAAVKFINGYPSILYLFARILQKHNLKLPTIQAIITTAEMLQPLYRQTIEEAFNCPVFNNLGCNDGGYESFECQHHQGFHYNDLQSILQVHTPTPGQAERLLITNLWNKTTPFIRYENGDCVTLAKDACPCGRKFPLIQSIEGRTADILSFSNGKSVAGPALSLIFGSLNIDGWQIVQTSIDTLEVRIKSAAPLSDHDRKHINHILSYHCGPECTITIKNVDSLETTKGGKLKPIWSMVHT
ncbi:MAG: phenylacetate--CoA ligase family protein [Chitinivibrionales bacterium]|nr:phenylacetate--CoA ligase family protein [Chitinivibrionales bacterium]